MNPTLRLSLFVVVAGLFGTASLRAQTILAQWNFNGVTDTNSPAPSLGAGTATLVGGTTASLATGSASDPATVDNQAWNTTTYPPQGTAPKSAGVQFAVSTVGYQGISVQFDFRASNTASRQLLPQYSVNGVDFTDATPFVISTGGSFTNGLVVDLSGIAAVADQAGFVLRFVSDYADGAGYAAVSGTYGSGGTWRFDMVTVTGQEIGGEPEAPKILTHPQSRGVPVGGAATFSVTASGTAPLAFQWQRAQTNLPGAVSATLTLNPVVATDAGAYRVLVSNALGSATSDEATLTVTNPPPSNMVTNIGHLHTLLDPVNFTPTDTTTLFTVEGVVTTWVNLTTTASGLFYVQDDTGGIAVFHNGAAGKVPPAGARVRVTAPLTHFNGLLELAPVASNASHPVETLSTNLPLPTPRKTSPTELATLTAVEIEGDYEGRLLTFTNVTAPPELKTFAAGSNVNITDEGGYPYTLRIDARTDIAGQPVPAGPFGIIGVLSQFDTGDPRDSAYQILPSRFADILTPSKAPTVRFTNTLANLVRPGEALTNTYAELGLRRGETLTIQITVTDPLGGSVTVEPASTGLPTGAAWNFPSLSGPQVEGTFTVTAQPGDEGKLYDLTLVARNGTADNTTIWKLYIPTEAEERVAIAEYLANPTGTAEAAHYNPLRRDPPTDNTGQHDEYVELANLSSTELDLAGWSIADGVGVRHRFYDSFVLGAKSAAIVYGGPLNGLLPTIEVPSIPASESSAGLALNNDGDTIVVRNQLGGVVERLVYPFGAVSGGGSMTRFPTIDHGFVAQTNVATLAVTPGRQYDGKLWSEPPTIPVTEVGSISASLTATGSVRIIWNVVVGQTYSVLAAPVLSGPWNAVASGLTQGEYMDSPPAGTAARYYRISTP